MYKNCVSRDSLQVIIDVKKSQGSRVQDDRLGYAFVTRKRKKVSDMISKASYRIDCVKWMIVSAHRNAH